MENARVIKTLNFGRGCDLLITTDDSKPETSMDKYTVVVRHDGSEGSPPLSVPSHWHKHHDEYITIVEGRCSITLNGKATIVEAGDPAVFIPRWTTHSMEGFRGEKMTMHEQQNPPGLYKGLFFNDLLSEGQMPGFWHVMRSFYDGDTYPGLPANIKFLEQLMIWILGPIAKLVAKARSEQF